MNVVRSLLVVAYPVLVFAGLRVLSPREVALGIAAVFVLRGVLRWPRPDPASLRPLLPPALILAAVLLGTVWWNDARLLMAVPAIVNGALLVAFGRTLRGPGPTLVESLARLQVPDLPEDEVAYCRGVTWVWCLFFAANGSVCLGLALYGDPGPWALYTGLVSYLLVGLLFSVEFVVRSSRFGRYEGTLVEPLFRRWFPRSRGAAR